MPQRSRSDFLSTIFDWLKFRFAPTKAEEPPKERGRVFTLSGKSINLVPFNVVMEVDDSDPWALCTLKITPLRYRDRSTIPIRSTKEFWYIFLHKIPPSQRNQPVVTLHAAGQEFKVRRSLTGSSFGVHRLTVLHVANRDDQATWQPVFVEQLKFSEDAIARDFMARLATMLLVKKCEGVAWPKLVEEMLKRSRLGHNRKLGDEELVADPYKARRER